MTFVLKRWAPRLLAWAIDRQVRAARASGAQPA
jgi:hypothetical protein